MSQVNVPSPSNVQCQHVTYISLIPNSTVAREWIVSRLTSHGSRSTVHGPRSTVTSYRLSTIDYRLSTLDYSSIEYLYFTSAVKATHVTFKIVRYIISTFSHPAYSHNPACHRSVRSQPRRRTVRSKPEATSTS